jgi:branched-chain amino acid transport system substrate-binding protein
MPAGVAAYEGPPPARERRIEMKIGGIAAALFIIGVGTAGPVLAAEQPYDLAVILPLTGPSALLGHGQQESLELAEKVVNAQGGINGRPLHLVYYDDSANPQISVQIASELIADHPPVFLGPVIAATCLAVAPLLKDGPVSYCLGTAIHPEAGSTMFSASVSTEDLLAGVVRYFHGRGWSRLGMVITNDASGQDGERSFDKALAAPDMQDVKIIERVRFAPTDVSIGAQVERLRAANPQALLAWPTGASLGTAFRGMAQANFEPPTAVSTANMLYSVMAQFKSILPHELYFGSSLAAAQSDRLKFSPGSEKARQTVDAAFEATGHLPDGGAANSWDPLMIVVDALRHTGSDSTAVKIKDYVSHLQDFDGISGHYDFVRHPQRGLGPENAVVVRWNEDKGIFEMVTAPGGGPLEP